MPGVAPICVNAAGQNSIVIVAGANDLLTPEELTERESLLAGACVVVTQLEIKVETTLQALKLARKHGAVTIFNPAPARSDLPDEYCRSASADTKSVFLSTQLKCVLVRG